MDKKELLSRFKQFCKGLKPIDRIAILHHSDADGFCSALITAKAIERLTGKKPVVVQHYEYGNRRLAEKAASLMKGKKANVLILVDLGIDTEKKGLLSKCKFEKCLVIDHHRMAKDLNSKRVLFLKAEFFAKRDPSAYVASKFAFDLFNTVTDVNELDWLACLGIMGDMNLGNWKGFVRQTVKRRKIPLSSLCKLLDLIASVEVLADSKMHQLFWVFYKAGKPAIILKSPFKKYLKAFKKEKDSLVESCRKSEECFPELELCFFSMRKGHENIKSYVINEISESFPNKTIVLLHCIGGKRVKFSARRQDFKVKVNELLVEAVKGIPNSSAGGHVPAAAGSLPKRFVSRFKRKVVEILKKKYGK